ncbi:MAG: helix-turn-helix domain-containing protein [Victivallaceae bacterium]|nr:helix-turn-helix domain-containing protein [Victivallaceae bacterium]
MIKVLDKTFAILEMLATASPQPITPSEISTAHGINRSTCSRILKELCDLGYAEQISRQRGYSVGPRALTLGRAVNYRRDLLNFAVPAVNRCAEELGQSVLIAENRGNSRYILYYSNRSKLNIHFDVVVFNDLFETATGLVLAAYAGASEKLEFFRNAKARGENFFPEYSDEADAMAGLAQIRADGFVVRRDFREEQDIIAFPLFRNREFIASLGISMPVGEFNDDIFKRSRLAAEEINLAMSRIASIG